MRILIVTSRFPLPTWRGNQVRTMEWLQALEEHDRILVCPGPDHPEQLRELKRLAVAPCFYTTSPLARIGSLAATTVTGWPMQEGLYGTCSAIRRVRDAVREQRPDVMVVQMVRCGWALERARLESPELPVVFDAIDAMGLHFQRASETVNRTMRFAYQREAARCRRRERVLAKLAEVTTAVSARDLRAMGADSPNDLVVPVAGREPSLSRRRGGSPVVLLSGNLGYRPTVEGAAFIAREVWPVVRDRVPGVRWVLAGARPAAAVRRLGRLSGVEIHEDLPSLDPFLAEATVSIAPMESGSGIPMKVLEAWAAGVPVVAHPWTAAGLDEDDQSGLVAASTREEWIDALVTVLTDDRRADELGRTGRAIWTGRYHPRVVAERIRQAVQTAVEVAS